MDITIEQKNKNKHIYRFTSDESPITIGRHNCKVNMDSNSISKIHCTLEYNINTNFWQISDGSGDKISLHGIWLWIVNKIEISCETQIKLGNNIFSLTMY
jgi:hypothetical protein